MMGGGGYDPETYTEEYDYDNWKRDSPLNQVIRCSLPKKVIDEQQILNLEIEVHPLPENVVVGKISKEQQIENLESELVYKKMSYDSAEFFLNIKVEKAAKESNIDADPGVVSVKEKRDVVAMDYHMTLHKLVSLQQLFLS